MANVQVEDLTKAHHHEEMHVEKTTPQGTQENGVDFGHEQRDVKMGALFRWFGGMAVTVAATFVLMNLLFAYFLYREKSKDVMPSRLYEARPKPPKDQPSLLPRPWDHLTEFQQAEAKRMQQKGLQDAQTGLPKLPDNAASVAGASSGGTASTFHDMRQMPADSSGGLTGELNQR